MSAIACGWPPHIRLLFPCAQGAVSLMLAAAAQEAAAATLAHSGRLGSGRSQPGTANRSTGGADGISGTR